MYKTIQFIGAVIALICMVISAHLGDVAHTLMFIAILQWFRENIREEAERDE